MDDDVHTCTSVSKMLREIEMRADWSTSGKDAVIRTKEAFKQNDAFKAYIIDRLMSDMNAHITKPIDIETIVDVLDQVLGTP